MKHLSLTSEDKAPIGEMKHLSLIFSSQNGLKTLIEVPKL
jgi:hypothetical protein